MENCVEIKGLVKKYKGFTLGPIDLNIPKGAIVGYIGQNGAGKSTTIKAILGYIKPDGGSIKVFGKSVEDLTSEDRNKIGVVLDRLHLPENMSLKEIEKFCSMLYSHWDGKLFHELKKKLEIPENRKISEISRGTSMKLSLMIALCHNAQLLILDEPTGGLDPIVRKDIIDMLMEFIQDENHSVFISSHIISDLEYTTDYIALIHQGKLLFVENLDNLQERYGICRLDAESVNSLSEDAIVGKRENKFGVELLVYRNQIPIDIPLEKANLEDIMLFMVRGGRNESVDI